MVKSTGARFRPRVEPLEVREVLANYTAATVPELIAAIEAANLTPEADTLTLAPGHTFTLTAANNSSDGPTGLPVIAPGEDLSIVGNGAVIERSSAADTPEFRLFAVSAGASLTLQNLTLQGGLASGRGGAVYSEGNLTLAHVTARKNIAQGAPGFYWCYWGGCGAHPGENAYGGAVYSVGTLTMTSCTVTNNQAVGGQGYRGSVGSGGNDGGHAYGGGVYVGGGTATITGSSITSNVAKGGNKHGEGFGGGIYIDPSASVGLDDFTVGHVKQNKASTSGNNISGPYVGL